MPRGFRTTGRIPGQSRNLRTRPSARPAGHTKDTNPEQLSQRVKARKTALECPIDSAAPKGGSCGGINRRRLAVPQREGLSFVYARETLMYLCGDAFPTTCRLPRYPLQRLGQRPATETMRLLLRKLANAEVRLLLMSTRSTEGYPQDLHLGVSGARATRPASHLARYP